MKRTFLTIALFASTSAFAGGYQLFGGDSQNQDQSQAQLQGQLQGQAQQSQQRQTIGDLSADNELAVSVPVAQTLTSSPTATAVVQDSGERNYSGGYSVDSNVRYSGDYTVRAAPSIGLTTGSPTAPCIIPIGIGGSMIAQALQINGYIRDEECTYMEWYRMTRGDPHLEPVAREIALTALRKLRTEQSGEGKGGWFSAGADQTKAFGY